MSFAYIWSFISHLKDNIVKYIHPLKDAVLLLLCLLSGIFQWSFIIPEASVRCGVTGGQPEMRSRWHGVCKKKIPYTGLFYFDKVSWSLPPSPILPKKEINHKTKHRRYAYIWPKSSVWPPLAFALVITQLSTQDEAMAGWSDIVRY